MMKLKRSMLIWFVAIQVSFGFLATASADVAQNLIAYYPFDGNALDQSGNGQHGTVDGAVLSKDRYGRAGRAYYFDGASTSIEIPVNINPAVHPQLTMTAWVRADNASPIRQVVSHDNGGYDRSFGIDSRGGGTGWSAFSGSAGVVGFHPVDVGKWTFLAVVYDQPNETVRLYVNGTNVYEESGELGTGWDFALIGTNPSFNEFFKGPIDEVRIYDRALSGARIQEIYQYSGLMPDLVVSKLSAPSTAQVGQTISIFNVVKNYDGKKAAQSVTRFYLSKDAAITPGDDRYLGRRQIPELPPLKTSKASNSVVVPADLPPGTYYIGAMADATKSVNEADEKNNVRVRKITITE
jgi:hypothetical protein